MITLTLSQRLRDETTAAHTEAEGSTFMVDLLAGRLGVDAFIALQEQALLFYEPLEAAVSALRADARVAAVADDRLARAPRLRADLRALGGDTSPAALPETADYARELERIRVERDVSALLAHHYVRYLGDLSGGQIISRRMQQNYGVPQQALSFFRFDGIRKLKPYKDGYRHTIDALGLSATQADAVVRRANEAFTHNHRVFRGLSRWTRDSSAKS